MAVLEAERYLPKEQGASHAFDEVKRWHSGIITLEEIKELPLEKIQRVTADYVTTAVAYFANRAEDKLLEDVGTTAWHAINQRRVLTAYCDDARIGAIQVGLPQHYALSLSPDEPNLVVMGNRQGRVVGETTVAIIPPHLILKAQQRPIEALAAMVFILSQVRDFSNGRVYVDRELMTPRAVAIEAQFLLTALGEQPDLQLAPIYREVLTRYPHGINDLPASARYRGTTGAEAKKADQN